MTIKDLIIQYKAELALTNKHIEELKGRMGSALGGDHRSLWDMYHAQESFAAGIAQILTNVIKDMESIDE